MIRKIKTLGVAFVAALAMSAVVASTAFATNDIFTVPSGGTTTLTGTQGSGAGKLKFKIVGQTIECETATFDATVTGMALPQITQITPTYSGCTIFGVPATFESNGCQYGIAGWTDPNGHAETRIESCEADKHITLTMTGIECDITLKEAGATDGNRTLIEGVRYTNIGSGSTRELTVDVTAKFKVSVDTWPAGASNPLCAEIEPATTVRVTGSITATGEGFGGSHVGIEVS